MNVVALSNWAYIQISALSPGDLFTAKMSDIDVLALLTEDRRERFGLILYMAANDPFGTPVLPVERSISTLGDKALKFSGKAVARAIPQTVENSNFGHPSLHTRMGHGNLIVDDALMPWIAVQERNGSPPFYFVNLQSGEIASSMAGTIYPRWELAAMENDKIGGAIVQFGNQPPVT